MKQAMIRMTVVLVAMAALGSGAMALQQTVNSTDSAATIQAAINAVLASADASGEVVFNAGTYVLSASLDVIMNSDGDITLRGSDPNNRPILVCPNYTGAGAEDGCFTIGGTGTTLTFKDMIILPPDVGGSPFANAEVIGIGGRSTLANDTLNFENVLLTGNAGGNVPAGTDGTADPRTFPNLTRFENACINLLPAAANVNTLIINATNLICSMGGAEGYYLAGGTGSRGALNATFTNCVFTWNAADGFRSTNIGNDDRYIGCVFNWNGAGQNFDSQNQGIHNSSRAVDDGGSSYFEGCEASYNADRGFYIGTERYGTVIDCTAIENGFFPGGLPAGAFAATGFDFTGGSSQQNFLLDGAYCQNNGGGSIKISGGQAPTAATANCTIRNVVSLRNGNNEDIARDSSGYRGGIQFGGEVTGLLENCYIENSSGVAIWHDSALGGTYEPESVTIQDCTVVHAGMNGVLVWDVADNADVTLRNVTLIDTSNDPAAITGSANRGSAINMRAPGLPANGSVTL